MASLNHHVNAGLPLGPRCKESQPADEYVLVRPCSPVAHTPPSKDKSNAFLPSSKQQTEKEQQQPFSATQMQHLRQLQTRFSQPFSEFSSGCSSAAAVINVLPRVPEPDWNSPTFRRKLIWTENPFNYLPDEHKDGG